MSIWRPRSVLQLVLVGFFTALAPLCVAILFTLQTLEDLASNARDVTRRVIDVTRLGQDIENELLQLERHTRQYLALADPELALLAQEERNRLLQQLQALQLLVGEHGIDAAALQDQLQDLDLARPPTELAESRSADTTSADADIDQQFLVINERRRGLHQWLQSWVNTLQAQNVASAEAVIDALFLQLLFLSLATLALLLLFSYWINKPVQQLSREIHKLGTTGLDNTISISGPEEVAELGRRLDWLRQRLHDTEQQKQQFLRHISHELKTPLASLREGTDLLAEQVTGRLSRQQQEVVDIVRRNAIELQRLIENLVDYNQLPGQQLVVEEIDLASLLQDILANYRITIDQKELELDCRGTVAHWAADRQKLKTALDNLLSNAVNYTPPGGRIDVEWRGDTANLMVEVANSGQPIPREDRDQVFEAFFQSTAKRTGPLKGSGLGLSVARDCMQAQGGTLELIDHPAFPVCFRLSCPARPA